MNQIKDIYQRPLRDLRISVTDQCNFRCQYCMPAEIFGSDYPFLKKDELLSFDEIERLARVFTNLGVKKLRITGGEPLLRPELPRLIERLIKINGIEDIGLTTNGVFLTKQSEALYRAGLRRLNISLDSIDDTLFKKMNGRGISHRSILKGIDKAKELGFRIKINMVVQKGINDSQILPMANYFKDKGITLRFIEFMDVGNHNGWNWEKVVSMNAILESLRTQFELEPLEENYYGEVAKRYKYKGTNTEIGFISSVSETFCSSCTRARISADGNLYTCLFASKGFSLKELLKSNINDESLLKKVSEIWRNRDDRYSDLRKEGTSDNRKIEMSFIGG
ncbi:cyclic pyranopterin phosphate synthase [Bacillus pakistanensis]|uniref:GTP 3',8-cyclase n=1 Tax=Rossellomorea pakistanensis TaxID=992288 RepID=A0ABS2N8B5_9BACI|nr:GTP 3',8-cyclase MoaA [Bacillus pakistanensis]MBM7584107.1 cyclic pyranopterin phosphate synthase [Bacillus pakistanensis]